MDDLNWMEENNIISEDEYNNWVKRILEKERPEPSGDHDPGSSTGAAAAPVAGPGQTVKQKIVKEDMEYINRHVKPQATGCTIYNDDRQGESWVARYQLIPGTDTTKTQSYIDKKGRRIEGKNSRNCLNWVLHWAWGCHTAATGHPCPWDFTPRCAD